MVWYGTVLLSGCLSGLLACENIKKIISFFFFKFGMQVYFDDLH